MIRPELKQFLLRAIEITSNTDNYAMTQRVFRNCTREEMQQEYGESGRTRQEILDDWKADVELSEEARQWVEQL